MTRTLLGAFAMLALLGAAIVLYSHREPAPVGEPLPDER